MFLAQGSRLPNLANLPLLGVNLLLIFNFLSISYLLKLLVLFQSGIVKLLLSRYFTR